MSDRWSWQKQITKSNLPPTTRHVLLTLATYMNAQGQNAYPTIKTLCSDTGLSNKCVITHLQKAKELGWIEVRKHGFKGQKWKNHEYDPIWQGSEPDVLKAVNLVPEGSEPSSKKVVKEVHTSNTIQLNNSNTYSSAFDIFWNTYVLATLPQKKRSGKAKYKKDYIKFAKKHGIKRMEYAIKAYYEDNKSDNYQFSNGLQYLGEGFDSYLKSDDDLFSSEKVVQPIKRKTEAEKADDYAREMGFKNHADMMAKRGRDA